MYAVCYTSAPYICSEQNINLSSKRTQKKSVCQVTFLFAWEFRGTFFFFSAHISEKTMEWIL